MGSRQRQRGVQQQWLVKAWSMDDRSTERRGARRGIGQHQTIPARRAQPQGSLACTDLPGLLAVGRCRSDGVVLVRARAGADARPPPRFAPLPLLGREDRPPRREVDGTTRHRAWHAGRLELRQGKAPITDDRFGGGELRLDLLEQASLQGGFARLGPFAPHQEAGHGQTLRTDRPDPGREAHGDGRQRLPRCGRVVLGRAVLKPRTKEADQVTGDRAIAPVLVGLQAALFTDELLPGAQQLGGVPLAIRQSRPAAPDGMCSQPQIGKPRDDGPTALEQATAEQHPQQMEEPQIGTARYPSDYARQNPIDTLEYGGHQGTLLQVEMC